MIWDLYSPVLHLAMGLRHNLFKDRLYYFQSITLMCNFSCGIKNLPLKPLELLLFRPSIKDWVLRKRGLDVDNWCLKFLYNFRKRKIYIFKLHFIQFFSADAKIFKKKIIIFFDPQNIKNSPKKLLIIPLDHQFSVQQVFSLWNWDRFKVVWG